MLSEHHELQIMWFHREDSVASSKYYFLDNKLDNVSMDSVICNRVEFEPLFEDRLL
jgi:hypothetical protein